jgi:hypothetical protein
MGAEMTNLKAPVLLWIASLAGILSKSGSLPRSLTGANPWIETNFAVRTMNALNWRTIVGNLGQMTWRFQFLKRSVAGLLEYLSVREC